VVLMDKVKKKQPYPKGSHEEILAAFKKKTIKLHITAATIFCFSCLVGALASTPGFSITLMFAEELLSKPELVPLLEKLLTFFSNAPDELPDDPTALAKVIKSFFILLIVGGILYLLRERDPFGDERHLRDLRINGVQPTMRQHLPFSQELLFYAHNVPSSRMHELCEECTDRNKCHNKIDKNSSTEIAYWEEIYPALPAKLLKAQLRSTYRCRRAFLYKYGSLFSCVFLLFIGGAGQTFGWFYHGHSEISTIWLVFLFFTFFTWLLCSFTNRINKNESGSWGRLVGAVDKLFRSKDFQKIFADKVCNYISPISGLVPIVSGSPDDTPEKIRHLKELNYFRSLITHLDLLLEKKTFRILDSDRPLPFSGTDGIKALLDNLVDYYEALDDESKEHLYCASLFVLSDDRSYVVPYLTSCSDGCEFKSIVDTKEVNSGHLRKNFTLNGGGVVAKCWHKKEIIYSKENLPLFHSEKGLHLRSMMAYPIFSTDSINNITKELGLPADQIVAVLCVESTNKSIFTIENNMLNKVVISAFANRILHELTINLEYVSRARNKRLLEED